MKLECLNDYVATLMLTQSEMLVLSQSHRLARCALGNVKPNSPAVANVNAGNINGRFVTSQRVRQVQYLNGCA